ncbi:hypothetical protein BHE74_00029960 [Ensete ventricosum]|nr:hypothetical protein BHE74_00029960 [Ensete ventricosum]RZR92043.1 hypothetical protein BHM03_00020260 [Ensete ventricosum]
MPTAYKRSPAGATPVGISATRQGYCLSPAGAAPTRSQSAEGWHQWRCRPWERSWLQRWPPLSRVAASGQGSHRLCRGGCGGDVKGAKGLGHSF